MESDSGVNAFYRNNVDEVEQILIFQSIRTKTSKVVLKQIVSQILFTAGEFECMLAITNCLKVPNSYGSSRN